MTLAPARWRGLRSHVLRLLALTALCILALQGVFAARIALMTVIDPQSTAFQRSEVWRLVVEKHRIAWGQQWLPAERISERLQRAVIASEDAGFVDHHGVEWASIEKAWDRNQRAGQQVQRQRAGTKPGAAPRPPKLVGGSTISQQLAKNLLLSGERTVLRKTQELVLTFLLEAVLSKERILEIYLNNVEWGEGLFGAQAAARYYFRVDAARLSSEQAARLAVMLPAPKHHEKQPASAYVLGRAATIQARMDAVELP
jgi:monofunctional biosynthetic peptidoglycan transglycosylase